MIGRVFSGGYLAHASALVSAYPWSFFAWVKVNSGASGVDTIFSIWNGSDLATGWGVENNGGKACFRSSTTGGAPSATVATAFTAGVWQPVFVSAASATSRSIWAITTANTATNTTSSTPGTVTRTAIGTRHSSGVPEYNFAGEIAHATLWNIANFTVDEIAALFAGAVPRHMRRQSLVAAPDIDHGTRDLVAPRVWTLTGTSLATSGPPVVFSSNVATVINEATSTAEFLTAQISNSDTYYANKFALQASDKGKMAVAIVTFDDTDKSISVEVNERTAQSVSAAVSFNAQSGNLFLGCDLNNGTPTDSSSVTALIHSARAYNYVLDSTTRGKVLDAVADDLKPVVEGVTKTISSTQPTTISLTNFVKDPSGYGWTVTSAAPFDSGCTAAPSGQGVRITPVGGAGVTTVVATVTNSWIRPRSVTLPMTLTKQADPGDDGGGDTTVDPTDAAYTYAYTLPWLPTSASDVVTANIDATNGYTIGSDGGDPDKLLLLIAPQEAITGKINLNDFKYRGIVLIGATFEYTATGSKETPAGNDVPFSHFMQARCAPATTRAGNPFIFLANIKWKAMAVQSGDWLQTGTVRQAANQDEWPDIYMQKIWISNGHYFFTSPGQDFDPHADVVQITNNRGFRKCYVANCDIRWHGQGHFLYASKAQNGSPHPNAWFEMRDTIWRAMPQSNTISNNNQYSKYIAVAATPQVDYQNLDFIPTRLTNVYAEFQSGPDRSNGQEYFSPNALWNATTKIASWPTQKYPNTAAGVIPITGTVSFNAPTTPVLDTSQTGFDYRVTSYDDLKAIF